MYSVISLQFKTTVFYVNVFERFYKSSNFFDQKYSENNNIVKYYYNLNELFSVVMLKCNLFIHVIKAEFSAFILRKSF